LDLKDEQLLLIEHSVLTALLRVPRYRHGARSMEKIVLPMKGLPGEPLRRANLPPEGDLNRHLETVTDFQRLLDEARLFRTDENLRRVAAAIHEGYRTVVAGEPPNPDFNRDFEKLDAWGQATNIAAAAWLPEVLAFAGLRLTSEHPAQPDQTDVIQAQIEYHLEVLAEAEHDLWMQFLAHNDWRPFQSRDNERLLYDRLVRYADLPEDEKNKDRATVRAYPDMARLARYQIAFIGDGTISSGSPAADQQGQ
jgi:hypothetical protein